MNKLLKGRRGIPFSHEHKTHEHIHVSLLIGRRTKGNFAFFSSFLEFFERGFLQQISPFDGKEWPIKAEVITEQNWVYIYISRIKYDI